MRGERGDARTHRQENQRLDDDDFDPDVFKTDEEGRVTLSLSSKMRKALAEELLSESAMELGPGLEMRGGRITLTAGSSIPRLRDAGSGDVSEDGTIPATTADAIATLTHHVEKLRQALSMDPDAS